MSNNPKQSAAGGAQTQRYSSPYQPISQSGSRADGFAVSAPQTAYVAQQTNQGGNQGPALRGIAPSGPPNQSSTPPNAAEIKVQALHQPTSMNHMFMQPRATQFYARSAAPPSQTQRMPNHNNRPQAPVYGAQAQYVNMPVPAHQTTFLVANPAAATVPYYNTAQRPPTGFVAQPNIMYTTGHPLSYNPYQPTPSQTQAMTYFYNQQSMMQRTGPIAQTPTGTPTPTPGAVPSVSMVPNPPPQQPVQRHQNKRRPKAISIIDPNTGADRLDEIFEDNSHPPSGESSARQTPQPNHSSHSKEVQATFAKQVLQAISGDTDIGTSNTVGTAAGGGSAIVRVEDPVIVSHHHQHDHQEELAGEQTLGHAVGGATYPANVVPPGVPSQQPQPPHPKTEYPKSNLQAMAKEFVSKEPPIVSANCDAEEVTLPNKLPKERESPVKSRGKRDQQQQNQKGGDQKDVSSKDQLTSDKHQSVKDDAKQKEPSSQTNVSPQPQVNSKEAVKEDCKKGQKQKDSKQPLLQETAVVDSSNSNQVQQQAQLMQDSNPNSKNKQNSSRQQSVPKPHNPTPVGQTSNQSATAKHAQQQHQPMISTPQPQPVKAGNKSHRKNEINQKGASKEGTDMDAFNDNTAAITEVNANLTKTATVPNSNAHPTTTPIVSSNDIINANVIHTNEQPKDTHYLEANNKKNESNDMTIKMEPVKSIKPKVDVTDIVKEKPRQLKSFSTPTVAATVIPPQHPHVTEISHDETDRAATDKLVQAKNEINAKTSAYSEYANKLKYEDGQWSPWNQTGHQIYSMEFLLVLRDFPASRRKPENIPVVVAADDRGRLSEGRLSMGGRTTDFMNPPFNSFGGKSSSQRGSMPTKRNSQSKMDNKKAAKPSMKLTISLKEDVKLHESENAWRPARFLKGEHAGEDDKKTEELYKKVRGVLNKLTPQKFDTLLSQIKSLKIDTAERLQGVIDLVFEKAVDEPNFSVAYALMCRELALMQVPTSNSTPEKPEFVNFRKLLLTRCQMEFEKQSVDEGFRNEKLKEIEECTDAEKKKDLQFELDEYDRKLRRKSVGNIRFIGELFKQNMLTVNIMQRCLYNLIESKDEESLECLCKLLTTIGKELESKNSLDLHPIISRMKNIADKKEGKVSSRIRFMLQDVIDLRSSKWVPRRQDHNPKTIDQIQKEADQEQMNIQIMNSVTPTPRKEDSRSSSNTLDRKGGRGGRNSSSDAEGWITNTRTRPVQFSVQSDKLKTKPLTTDEPLGNMGMFQIWNKGSQSSSTKTQSQLLGPNTANMYAALENIESDKRSLGGGRMTSGPKDPYMSKGPSLERYNKYDGRGSRSGSQHRSVEGQQRGPLVGSGSAPPPASMNPVSAPQIPQPQKAPTQAMVQPPQQIPAPIEHLTEEQLERRINNCLDEYVNENCSIEEYYQDIVTFVPPAKFAKMISDSYLRVLEKSPQARLKTGLLFAKLVKQRNLPLSDYCMGLEEIFAQADDLKIDIPKIWDYLAEILVDALCEEALPMDRLQKAIQVLIEQKQAVKVLVPLFKLVVNKKGPDFLQKIWHQSSLQLTDFMDVSEVDKFVQTNHFEFLIGGPTQVGQSQMSFEQIQTKLSEFFRNKASFDEIVNWITANVGDRVNENKFVRALATAIFQDSIGPNYKLVAETLAQHNNLLLRYVDSNPKYELECLYALQALINKMEHPQGLLLQICDKLYELASFSQESFIAWEASTDPAEQAGKGVALKQLTSFFTQLKENDEDESSESDNVPEAV